MNKVVIAAGQAIGLEKLTETILDMQIRNGLSIYCGGEDRLFCEVTVQRKNGSNITLFIYSIADSTLLC